MARRVFYSFCYQDDIDRVWVVRNRWVTFGGETASGVIDSAEYEKIKKKGDQAVYDWIDEQIEGTSVTVVLIGENTLERKFVQYEIQKSLKKGNAILGVYIHRIKNLKGETSSKGNVHTEIDKDADGNIIYFDDICDATYDYILDDGYENMGEWVEDAT